MVTKYQKRISAPMLDRMDTACRIKVSRVDYDKLSSDRLGELSAVNVDEPVAIVRAGISSYPETVAHHRGFGGE